MLDVVKQINIKQSNGTYLEKPIGVDYDKVEGMMSILSVLFPLNESRDESLTTLENAHATNNHAKDTYFWIKVNNNEGKAVYLCYALKQINILDSLIANDNFKVVNLATSSGGGGGPASGTSDVILPFRPEIDEIFDAPTEDGIYESVHNHPQGISFWIKFTSTEEQKLIFPLEQIEPNGFILLKDIPEESRLRNAIEQDITAAITSFYNVINRGVANHNDAAFEYIYATSEGFSGKARHSHSAYESFWLGIGWDPTVEDQESAYGEFGVQNAFYLCLAVKDIQEGEDLSEIFQERSSASAHIIDFSVVIGTIMQMAMGGILSFTDTQAGIRDPQAGDLLTYLPISESLEIPLNHIFTNIPMQSISLASRGEGFIPYESNTRIESETGDLIEETIYHNTFKFPKGSGVNDINDDTLVTVHTHEIDANTKSNLVTIVYHKGSQEEITKKYLKTEGTIDGRPFSRCVSADNIRLVPWSTGTDAEISAMLNGYYENLITLEEIKSVWHVGDVREVPLAAMGGIEGAGLEEEHAAQTLSLQIIDFNHDRISGTDNTALITVDSKYILGKDIDNEKEACCLTVASASNEPINWDTCGRRAWCNDVFYNALPLYLRNNIKTVDKIFYKITNPSSSTTSGVSALTQDKVFLPSLGEYYNLYSTSGFGHIEEMSYDEGDGNIFTASQYLLYATTLQDEDVWYKGDLGYGALTKHGVFKGKYWTRSMNELLTNTSGSYVAMYWNEDQNTVSGFRYYGYTSSLVSQPALRLPIAPAFCL